MTRNFDNFLLGLLWLLSIALATTFWMNIGYGFNILSSAHWAYLSELQASRTQIKFDFYVSLIAAITIGLVGLYIIMRPRIRRTVNPDTSVKTEPPIHTNVIPTNMPERETQKIPVTPDRPKILSQNRPMTPTGLTSTMRPPQQPLAPPTPRAVTPTPNITTPKTETKKPDPEIQNIFESGGYIIKPCQKIGKLVSPVIALGYDNTLWIATSGASVSDTQDAIQTLISLFDDTLGDSADDIIVHGCIVNTTEQSNNPDLISTFATLDEMKQFLSDKPNTKPDGFDNDLFDAISTYISTVTQYIGKE